MSPLGDEPVFVWDPYVRIGFCALISGVALVVPSFRVRERHRASGGQQGYSRARAGLARATARELGERGWGDPQGRLYRE